MKLITGQLATYFNGDSVDGQEFVCSPPPQPRVVRAERARGYNDFAVVVYVDKVRL